MPTPEGRELKALFSELLALEPPARAERLRAIGGADPALGADLQALLEADERADALLARLDSSGADSVDAYGLVGRTLDHFRVEGVLGAGGMGVVYRAHDLRLGRDVALKLLPPHLDLDPDARRRLLREARVAATLDHPNIATVFEVGEAGGHPYQAAALYRGETLRQRMARGSVAPAEALDIARQLLRGLVHAHAAGVVHRDLKPENIVLTAAGVVKIVDFGLATLPGTTSSTSPAGTVAYMAPEQLSGASADAPADLWALGVVLYEMLAGRRPHSGDPAPGPVPGLHGKAPAALESRRADLPARLGQVLDRLLERDPAARPHSAQAVLEELEAVESGPEAGAAAASRERKHPRMTRRRWLVAGTVVVLAIAGAWTFGAVRRSRAADVRSIAVRPFENLSPESASRYLGDGIAEEILDELGRIDGMRTVARTSSFAFRGKNLDVRAIGREMHVAAVLEGSIAAAGDRIRVWVRLVRTADGHVLWSDRYDRPLTDRLTLQDDIAGAVATALASRLRPPGRAAPRGPTPNQQAYDLYLEGRNLWFQRTPEALMQAAKVFQRAIALDSAYALAYAGLADVYAMLGSFEYAALPPAPAYEQARAAATRALRLDPQLGPAYAALANVAMNYDRDWAGAERDFSRALQLNPGYAPAHQWYAFLLMAEGREREALAHLDAAGELDPRSPLLATVRAQYFYFVRDFPEARRALQVALRLDPRFGPAHLVSALVDMQTGRAGVAVARLSRLRAASPDNPVVAAILGYAFGRAGQPDSARALGAWLRERARQRYVPPELPAIVDMGLGDRDSALAGIEQAFRERSGGVLYLPVDPLLDPLRSDPRFQKLLRRLPR